jgi:hypothetical protein
VISLREPVSYHSIIHLATDLKCCQKCIAAVDGPATLQQQGDALEGRPLGRYHLPLRIELLASLGSVPGRAGVANALSFCHRMSDLPSPLKSLLTRIQTPFASRRSLHAQDIQDAWAGRLKPTLGPISLCCSPYSSSAHRPCARNFHKKIRLMLPAAGYAGRASASCRAGRKVLSQNRRGRQRGRSMAPRGDRGEMTAGGRGTPRQTPRRCSRR